MVIFKQAAALETHLQEQRKKHLKIGFVPTMGALHAGHLSLLERSVQDGHYTVCSIFVNPTQFNNADDFRHYPVTLEKDLELLLASGCAVLFLPSVAEIYPPEHQKLHYELGALETELEGAFRPGHFQGVCEVVDRLLQITHPETLYMGQKDFQQCLVVQKLLQLTSPTPVNLQVGSTLREPDGLALSSRNLRLDAAQRRQAPAIFEALSNLKNSLHKQPFTTLEEQAVEKLQQRGFQVDYVCIRNAQTLEAPGNTGEPLVALAAASLGPVRLIDNLLLN